MMTPLEIRQLQVERDYWRRIAEELLGNMHNLLPTPSFRVANDGIVAVDRYGVGAAMEALRAALDRAGRGTETAGGEE
jgi:hypothetical protein